MLNDTQFIIKKGFWFLFFLLLFFFAPINIFNVRIREWMRTGNRKRARSNINELLNELSMKTYKLSISCLLMYDGFVQKPLWKRDQHWRWRESFKNQVHDCDLKKFDLKLLFFNQPHSWMVERVTQRNLFSIMFSKFIILIIFFFSQDTKYRLNAVCLHMGFFFDLCKVF
jgi:hypothetical protein